MRTAIRSERVRTLTDRMLLLLHNRVLRSSRQSVSRPASSLRSNKNPSRHRAFKGSGNQTRAVIHLGYLHAKTVGGNPAAHVEAEMKTVRTPTAVKFTRWLRNSVPPPTYVKAAGFKGRVDRWQGTRSDRAALSGDCAHFCRGPGHGRGAAGSPRRVRRRGSAKRVWSTSPRTPPECKCAGWSSG